VPRTETEQRRPGDIPPDPGPLEPVAEAVQAVKPRLRGWLHVGAAPLALVAGIVLVSLAPTALGRLGGAVFLAASVLLFGTSGLYHRGTWSRRRDGILRRLDHANIYIFIAATYTPFALMMLHGPSRAALLILIWVAAALGLLFRLFWLSAPRWLYTVLYLAMGWAAVGWFGQFYTAGGLAVFALILVGGLFYTFGAMVYGLKRPNPSPRWFGFHEIFHACTIGGFACHYAAISLVTYAAR
jgi:hemolysin III